MLLLLISLRVGGLGLFGFVCFTFTLSDALGGLLSFHFFFFVLCEGGSENKGMKVVAAIYHAVG